ncbi:MAG: hypothetical protein H0V44_18665 [Planctomycetes bacterium]|nr:hypothetical protein [Planctomycetota bacterium]
MLAVIRFGILFTIACIAACGPAKDNAAVTPVTVTDMKSVDALNSGVGAFEGISGNSKLGPYIRGKQLSCYLRGRPLWPSDAIGKPVKVRGRFHIHTVQGSGDDEVAGPAAGSKIVYVDDAVVQ